MLHVALCLAIAEATVMSIRWNCQKHNTNKNKRENKINYKKNNPPPPQKKNQQKNKRETNCETYNLKDMI